MIPLTQRWMAVMSACMCLSFLAGCAHSVGGGARRAALVATGAAVGGVAGAELGGGNSAVTVAGAAAGAGMALIAAGRNPDDVRLGFEDGYVRGQSDAIKRHYWMRQSLERGAADQGGDRVFYQLPGPAETPDGRVLVPHVVQIPVIE